MKVLIQASDYRVTKTQIVVDISTILHVLMSKSVKTKGSMANMGGDVKVVDGKLVWDPVYIRLVEGENAALWVLVLSLIHI